MAFLRLTPRQLEAFLAVQREGGFGAAAQSLSLTPSAVSQLVAELEATVGFRVFDRTTRKVTLTAAGQDFLNDATSAVAGLANAERAATLLRNRASGHVCIAAPQALAATLLPAVIEDFARSRPKVHVRLKDTAVEQLIAGVANADCDLAIGTDVDTADAAERHDLFESPWVLWCARSHPLAGQPSVKWSDLREHKVVAAGRDHEHSVPAMSLALPASQRIVPADVVDHVTTALGLAARGLSVTLAPQYVEHLAAPMGLVKRRVIGPEVKRKVCMYLPKRRSASPAAQAFADHLALWVRQTGSTTLTWPVPDATK
jgi:DNA-binding transcriptional LysR family regulator